MYFPSLSQAHLEAHAALRCAGEDDALVLNWTVFKYLHRRARAANPKEEHRQLEIAALDEQAVLEAYESAAHGKPGHDQGRPPADGPNAAR